MDALTSYVFFNYRDLMTLQEGLAHKSILGKVTTPAHKWSGFYGISTDAVLPYSNSLRSDPQRFTQGGIDD